MQGCSCVLPQLNAEEPGAQSCDRSWLATTQQPSTTVCLRTIAEACRLHPQGAIENRKRETIMVGLKEKTGRIGELEDALARVQLELERVEFSMKAKTSAFLISCPPSR